MSDIESKMTDCCGNSSKDVDNEVIYTNDNYRVEKISLVSNEETNFLYGIYNNEYNVLEVETRVLAQALNTADELDTAISAFFQGKAFGDVRVGSSTDSPVIATA